MAQGSIEWLMSRLGRATGSGFQYVMDRTKDGRPGAKRTRYLLEKVQERLTGLPVDNYVNAAMEWGTKQEPFARMAYAEKTGEFVSEVDFLPHPQIMAGVSPDGLIDNDGAIEIKCPITSNHIDTLIKGMDPKHIPQVQGVLWVTGRKWCDFISFDPRLPPKHQLYVQRIERDENYILKLDREVRAFLSEVDSHMEKLNA